MSYLPRLHWVHVTPFEAYEAEFPFANGRQHYKVLMFEWFKHGFTIYAVPTTDTNKT